MTDWMKINMYQLKQIDFASKRGMILLWDKLKGLLKDQAFVTRVLVLSLLLRAFSSLLSRSKSDPREDRGLAIFSLFSNLSPIKIATFLKKILTKSSTKKHRSIKLQDFEQDTGLLRRFGSSAESTNSTASSVSTSSDASLSYFAQSPDTTLASVDLSAKGVKGLQIPSGPVDINNFPYEIKEVPRAKPPRTWILGRFLGHLADLKPWRKDFNVVEDLFNKVNDWYDEVPGSKSVKLDLAGLETVFTWDPEIIHQITGPQSSKFRNSDTIRKAWSCFFPNSITVTEGEQWKRLKGIFIRTINRLDFNILPPSTNAVLEKGLKNYITKPVQQVVIWDCFAKITFDSFHKFMYEIDFNTIGGENVNILEDCLCVSSGLSDRLFVTIPILWKLPTKRNRLLQEAFERICVFTDDFVKKQEEKYLAERAERNRTGAKEDSEKKVNNLLDAMVHASFDENQPEKRTMSREEFRDQLAAAMFGGFDTTTSSTSFVLVQLAKSPHWQEKLYQEVKDLDLNKATAAQMDSLPILNNVLKETNRIKGVSPGIQRVPEVDLVLNGYYFKKDTNVFIDHQFMSKVPDYWLDRDDLEVFDPSRWDNGFKPKHGTYIPFGFGTHSCVGQRIGTAQLQVIISHICQNYKISEGSKPIRFVTSLGRTVSRDSDLTFTKR